MLIKAQTGILAIIAINAINMVLSQSTPTSELKQVEKLPAGVPTCTENEEVNSCIRDAFNYMLHNSAKGLPELNIPPADPFTRDRFNVQFSNDLINGRAAVKNVKISGISKSNLKKVEYHRDGNQIKLMVHYHAPRIQIEGKYKAEVQISSLSKFSSKGEFNISMIDIVSKSEHFAELYERDGHTYLKLKRVNLDPTLGNMHVHATGIVADPILNETLLQIVNENWRSLYKQVIEATRSTWEPLLLQYSNDFFAHLPFDFILTRSGE